MLIHSVTPAIMLHNRSDAPPLSVKQIGNDYFYIQSSPGGNCISGVYSTNPAVYLNLQANPCLLDGMPDSTHVSL